MRENESGVPCGDEVLDAVWRMTEFERHPSRAIDFLPVGREPHARVVRPAHPSAVWSPPEPSPHIHYALPGRPLELPPVLREGRAIETERVPGEPYSYRTVDIADRLPRLPIDYPYLRIDELWEALHRHGKRHAHRRVATLDLGTAARAGL